MGGVNDRGRKLAAGLGSTSSRAVNKPELLSSEPKQPQKEPISAMRTGNLRDSRTIPAQAGPKSGGGAEPVTAIFEPAPDEFGGEACLLAWSHRPQQLLGELSADHLRHIRTRRRFVAVRSAGT
jgi:hypothetical protein